MSEQIAIDAMGGDYAPREIVLGALDAVRRDGIPVVLVGDEAQIRPLVEAEGMQDHPSVTIHHALQTIEMDEHPAMAFRKKKDASVSVCARLVKDGTCGAMIAPGSTGAAVTVGLFGLGRIPGIHRPAIASVLPNEKGGLTLLIDAGASTQPEMKNLLQNALLGHYYAKEVYGIARPRVGLLNVGTESTKGNALITETYAAMQEQTQYEFIGNVEGREVLGGDVDVVVCDGFTGNALLKFGEGLARMFFTLMKDAVMTGGWRAKLGAWLLRPALRAMKRRVDYKEYGGAMLLGVNGGLVICHGASDRRAIANATRLAAKMTASRAHEKVRAALAAEAES